MENNTPDRSSAQRTPAGPPSDGDADRRKFLLQAARVLAGTVGGLTLYSLARIDSALGLEANQSGTQKAIRRKAERELVKYFHSRSKAREVLSTARAKELESTEDHGCTCGCSCGCRAKCQCACSQHPENLAVEGVGLWNTEFTTPGTNDGATKAGADDPKLPGLSKPALGAGIAALGAAAAWVILRRRAAEVSREA
jgi:hypothetical protein